MTLNLPVKRYAKDHFFAFKCPYYHFLYTWLYKSVCVSFDLSDMRKTTDDGILFMSQSKNDHVHK